MRVGDFFFLFFFPAASEGSSRESRRSAGERRFGRPSKQKECVVIITPANRGLPVPATKVAPSDPGVLVTPKGTLRPLHSCSSGGASAPPPPGGAREEGEARRRRCEARISTDASPRHARPARVRTHVDGGAASSQTLARFQKSTLRYLSNRHSIIHPRNICQRGGIPHLAHHFSLA